MDELRDMWRVQQDFQDRVHGKLAARERKMELTRNLCLYLQAEVVEFLQQLDWKEHRRQHGHTVITTNVLEEWVDIFKYWLAVGQLWGFAPEDLVREFHRKSAVVSQRFFQDCEMSLDPERVVVVDIDGVLADYAGGFLRFVSGRTGVSLSITDLPPGTDVMAWVAQHVGWGAMVELKREFRLNGLEGMGLSLEPMAREFLEAVRGVGGQVVVLTSRPADRFYRILSDTITWMNNHHLCFDAIWVAEEKVDWIIERLPRCALVVEDVPRYAFPLAEAGYRVWLVDQPYNKGPIPAGVVRLESLADAIQMLRVDGLPPPRLAGRPAWQKKC